MKKIMKLSMLSIMVLALIVGCGNKDGNGNGGNNLDNEKLSVILNDVMEPLNLEIGMMDETVDLKDADAVNYYLGLDSAEGIEEAIVSNAMISSQAYSISLIRTSKDADSKAIAKDIANGVDAMRWICVGADDVQTTVSGNLILLVMVDSAMELKTGEEIIDSFEGVVGSSVDATYQK